MAASTQENEDEITGINVTPMVDVMLVLLVIFMVTANFIVRDTVEVDLPRAAHGNETVQGLLNVVLDKTGKIFVDGAEVSEADMLLRAKSAIAQNADTRAIISADKTLAYGKVMHIIDDLKGQGISKFAHNIERESESLPQ